MRGCSDTIADEVDAVVLVWGFVGPLHLFAERDVPDDAVAHLLPKTNDYKRGGMCHRDTPET